MRRGWGREDRGRQTTHRQRTPTAGEEDGRRTMAGRRGSNRKGREAELDSEEEAATIR